MFNVWKFVSNKVAWHVVQRINDRALLPKYKLY